MKILYVITGLNFGGAETQLMRTVRYVVKNTVMKCAWFHSLSRNIRDL